MNVNLKKKRLILWVLSKKENPEHILSLHDCPPHDVVGSVEERRDVRRSVNDVNMCFVLFISRQTPKVSIKNFLNIDILVVHFIIPLHDYPAHDAVGSVEERLARWSDSLEWESSKGWSPVFQSNTFSGNRLFYDSFQGKRSSEKETEKLTLSIDH